MRTLKKVAFIVVAIFFIGCAKQQPKTTTILSNDESRSKIMEAIINDDKMISQFMDKMFNDEHARLMVAEKRDKIYMNQMMREISNDSIKAAKMMDHLMGMMQKDSSICRMLRGKMALNQHMKGIVGSTPMSCAEHK